MQIVLSILQLLGWLLLALIVILVAGLLFALFYPLKYLIDIQWIDEKRAKFQTHWLFYLFRAKISYLDDLIDGEVHYFGKKKVFSFDLTEKEDCSESKEKEVKKPKETADEGIISKIKGMIERIKEVYPKLKKIFLDEKNKDAVTHLKKEVMYLVKVMLPKKSKMDAVFSIGSPDLTGQVFGILACFLVLYHKEWKLIPDFESEDIYFKGSIFGKGKVYGYQLLGVILRIVFDKNCRRLYTIINRFMKWFKKSKQTEDNING